MKRNPWGGENNPERRTETPVRGNPWVGGVKPKGYFAAVDALIVKKEKMLQALQSIDLSTLTEAEWLSIKRSAQVNMPRSLKAALEEKETIKRTAPDYYELWTAILKKTVAQIEQRLEISEVMSRLLPGPVTAKVEYLQQELQDTKQLSDARVEIALKQAWVTLEHAMQSPNEMVRKSSKSLHAALVQHLSKTQRLISFHGNFNNYRLTIGKGATCRLQQLKLND